MCIFQLRRYRTLTYVFIEYNIWTNWDTDNQVINEDSMDMRLVFHKLHDNEVLKVFYEKGYQFVSFRGFFPVNDFTEADYYYSFFTNQPGS